MSREMAREKPFKRFTQVGHQMEPIGALNRLGSVFVSRSSIVSSTILAHNFQFWVGSHPGGRSVCCLVCEDIEHTVCLEVYNNRPEFAPTSEREIIYANLWNFPNGLWGQRHNTPENGVARGLCDLTLVSSSSSNHILSYDLPEKRLERNS